MTRPDDLLEVLCRAGAEFIVVGGVAATLHGSARVTQDLDVLYRRTDSNIELLVGALQPLRPRLRGAPADLPFRWDARTLRNGLNFTLLTSLGALDLLGEIAGVGTYERALDRTLQVDLGGGLHVGYLDLDALIASKRAAGRRKDLDALAELEVIREERARRDQQR